MTHDEKHRISEEVAESNGVRTWGALTGSTTEQPAPEEEPEERLSVGLSGPVATLVAIAAWTVGLWMGVTL